MHFSVLTSQGLIILNSTKLVYFSSNVIYSFITILYVIVMFVIYFWMKDIIKERAVEEQSKTIDVANEGLKSLV